MRNSTMEYKVNQAYEELKRLIQWNPNSEEKFLQKMVCLLLPGCKLCLNGMPVPLLRNCYSIFNGTKYR